MRLQRNNLFIPIAQKIRRSQGASMAIHLLCHWNGDGDIADAWIKHYLSMGVDEFHLILHGTDEENEMMLFLSKKYPIMIHDRYGGLLNEQNKVARLTSLAKKFVGDWIVVVDSDELLELSDSSLNETIANMVRRGTTNLYAPLLQRIMESGSLESGAEVVNPFTEFPLCSERLYHLLGAGKWAAFLDKYPLLRCGKDTQVQEGNHHPANGWAAVDPYLRGVTHHFKWRRGVRQRLEKAILNKRVSASTETEPYLRYLTAHDNILPTETSFPYSRRELFRRGLLRADPSSLDSVAKVWSGQVSQHGG
jgi:hypothetical protein